MATLAIILYKPKNPLDPDSSPQTDTEHTINVGTAGNKITFDKYDFTFTVENFDYTKKVYAPCQLNFQLHVTEVCEKGSTTPITQQLSHCSVLTTALDGYGVKLKYDESNIISYPCLNYYIYDINPEFGTENNTPTIRLYITAYSVDHRLTLHKTNRAFTAKKFLTEVVASDLTSGTLKDFGVPVNYYPKCLQFIRSYTKAVTENVDMPAVTTYTPVKEVIHPYMVQYNETYYNFVARTANRCGEFMYFEDGQLCLGLDQPFYDKPTPISYDDNTPKARKNSITKVSMHRLVTPDKNNLEAYYPKTMSKSNAAVKYASSNFVEDAKVGNDEFLFTMKKGDWVHSERDLYLPEGKMSLFPELFAKVLNNQTIASSLVQWGVEEGIRAASSKITANKLNDSFDDKYWKKYGLTDRVTKSDEESYMFTSNGNQWDGNLFGSVFDTNFSKELSLEFYHTLLEKERKVAQEAITVETGSDYDEKVKLGKVVKVNDKHYVVVGVTGSYENSGARGVEKYSFTGIPVEIISGFSFTVDCPITDKNGNTNNSNKETKTEVMLIIPPLYENGHICYSSMQRAIITTASDPQSYARVRIKYPWQTESEEESPFIRVAKDCAGEKFGINFKAEEKTEVLVDYEGGNVERPFVVGMLHSFAEKPQYPSRSIRSKNGHKIVFKDPSDGTAMFWNAAGGIFSLFTEVLPVGEFGATTTHRPNLKELAGGIEISDAYGFYKIDMSTDKRQINIACPMGKIDIGAFTGITINAPNGDIKICGKNVEIEATNNLNICSGSQIDRKIVAKGSDFGASLISDAVGSFVGAVMDLISPDLSLLRSLFEAFLKPCNGTLRIKSYRYLMLESGQYGVAQIPASGYKDGKVPSINKDNDKIITFTKGYNPANNLEPLLNFDTYKNKAVDLIVFYNLLVSKRQAFRNIINNHSDGVQGADDIAKEQHITGILNEFSGAGGAIDNHLIAGAAAQLHRQSILSAYDNMLTLKNIFNEVLNSDAKNPTITNQKIWEIIIAGIPNVNNFTEIIGNNNVNGFVNQRMVFNNDHNIKFQMVKNYISELNDHIDGKQLSVSDENNAEAFIEKLDFVSDSFLDKLKKSVVDTLSNKATNNSFAGPNFWKEFAYGTPFGRPWDDSSHSKGQILFSDSNLCRGATFPLKNVIDGNYKIDDTVYTLPRLKAKLYNYINN